MYHTLGATDTRLWLAVISRYHATWRLCLEKSVGSAASGGRVPPRHKPETPRSRVGEARTQRPTASVRCLRVRGAVQQAELRPATQKARLTPGWLSAAAFWGARHSSGDLRSTPSHNCADPIPWVLQDSILPHGSTPLCSTNTTGSRESPGVSPHSGTIAISRSIAPPPFRRCSWAPG